MVHLYKKNGYNIALDVNSGCVHAVDEVAFDIIGLYENHSKEEIVSEIESDLQNSLSREISSKHIGVLVMNKLKALNDVAYVRFASIYREFKDLETFMQELEKLKNEKEQNTK